MLILLPARILREIGSSFLSFFGSVLFPSRLAVNASCRGPGDSSQGAGAAFPAPAQRALSPLFFRDLWVGSIYEIWPGEQSAVTLGGRAVMSRRVLPAPAGSRCRFRVSVPGAGSGFQFPVSVPGLGSRSRARVPLQPRPGGAAGRCPRC